MEETLQELQIRYEEKSLKAAEFAKKAAEMTHTVYTAVFGKMERVQKGAKSCAGG